MRIMFATLIAATGLVVATTTAALASQPANGTVEKCAALLPKGKVYTFEIKGTVDATGDVHKLSGEMSVSDNGDQTDRAEESAAFGECIAKLIR
jgi:hypothetical protein